MVGQHRTGDIQISHRVLFGAEDHFGTGFFGDNVERPRRQDFGLGDHIVQTKQFDIDALQLWDQRSGETFIQPDLVLAGEEDLTVLELDLHDRIGGMAHGHRIIGEILFIGLAVEQIVTVLVAGQIHVISVIDHGLQIQHQVHDHVFGVVTGGLVGGDGDLADDLLYAQIDPENKGNVFR